MPASIRLRPSLFKLLLTLLLALALGAPAGGALAKPPHAAATRGAGASHAPAIEIDIDGVAGGGLSNGDARAVDDSARLPATACRLDGDCAALRLDPSSPLPVPMPRPGGLAMLGFGLALVVLRGQRPTNMTFRAE